MNLHRAEYCCREDDTHSHCALCPHHCRMTEGQDGRCRVRGMRDGDVRALGYGHIASAHVDPIEKKPLYHFRPGSEIFSIGGWGCNLRCYFCQNWTLSQQPVHVTEGDTVAPDRLVARAIAHQCRSIAYTYNEPLVGFEYVRDCARLARQQGLANVLVTNGFIETAPAGELLSLIDALNIDIKSMSDDFYRQHCKGSLEPVLRFSVQAIQAGCHVEITNLLIPPLNDAPETLAALARWVRTQLGEFTPLHLSAYRPEYQCELPPTPGTRLEAAFEICRRELPYVYIGNVATGTGQNTGCPQCGAELIARRGYHTRITGIAEGLCRRCKRKADIR